MILNKDGHITGDLGHCRPLECRRGIAGGLGMQTRTQLGDEQWGQMRSYLTHIWHSTCPSRWLMNNWGNWSSAGRRKHSASVYAWAQAVNSKSACGLALSWCFTKLIWVYKSLEKVSLSKGNPIIEKWGLVSPTAMQTLPLIKAPSSQAGDTLHIWGARQILELGLSVLSASLSGGQLSASNQKLDGWMNLWHVGNLRWPSQAFTQLKQSYEYTPEEQCLFFPLPLR